MRPLFVALILAVMLSPATTHCQTRRDEPAYSGKLDDNAWTRHIETQVCRQAAGQKPTCHDNCSWREYWIGWYDEIRISSGVPWPGSQFKTHEDMIRYIKARLKARGLPTYE
jgi:hypothetical protein